MALAEVQEHAGGSGNGPPRNRHSPAKLQAVMLNLRIPQVSEWDMTVMLRGQGKSPIQRNITHCCSVR